MCRGKDIPDPVREQTQCAVSEQSLLPTFVTSALSKYVPSLCSLSPAIRVTAWVVSSSSPFSRSMYTLKKKQKNYWLPPSAGKGVWEASTRTWSPARGAGELSGLIWVVSEPRMQWDHCQVTLLPLQWEYFKAESTLCDKKVLQMKKLTFLVPSSWLIADLAEGLRILTFKLLASEL